MTTTFKTTTMMGSTTAARLILTCLLSMALTGESFVSTVTRARPASTHSLLDDPSLLISTIDADIANIADDDFGTVFLGGIAVMFGGLLSAIIVGTIVDKRGLYANIVADSYIQSSDDEEFWKNLTEEEKIKTRELLDKIKGDRAGKQALQTLVDSDAPTATTKATEVSIPDAPPAPTNEPKKETGMFSDYD